MREYRLRGIVKSDLSVVDHDQAVRVFRDVLHTVGNENDRDPHFIPELPDLTQDLIPAVRVQSGGRLIQNEDLRIHREDSRDRNAALLSSGQVKGGSRKIFVLQPDPAQRIDRALPALLRGQLLILRAEHDVREHVRLEELVLRILEDQTNAGAQSLQVVLILPDVLSHIEDLTVRRLHESVKMLDQRRFSRSRMPDDPHELPFRDLQIDILQCIYRKGCILIICIADIFQFKQHLIPPSSPRRAR